MKTQAECWQALLDGKTLTHDGPFKDCHLTEGGDLVNEDNNPVQFNFSNYHNWSIKQETKTITKEQLDKIIKNGGWQTTAISDEIWSQI